MKIESSIEVVKPAKLTIPARIAKAADLFTSAITHISTALSKELTPTETGDVLTQVKTFGKVLESIEKIAKSKVVELLKEQGSEVGDKGTLQFVTENGTVLEGRGSGGGYDAKKVEAMLRAKELNPEKYMDMKISFTLNEGKMLEGVAKKRFTQDELDTCRTARTYAIQTPKKQGEQE